MTTLEHSDNEDNEQEADLSLQDIAEKNVVRGLFNINVEHLFNRMSQILQLFN